ncbi:response regulator [Sphingomonas sp.]|uniref:response regulator n=1 Tax=Sphingomonas sp. TaxID=28214 RepID=UPI003B3A9F77
MTLRILIVEDEMTIAFMLEDMVSEMGHEVVEVAMRLPDALSAARTAAIDLAILDINLDGRPSFEVADVLRARGVPFFFSTGYGSAGLDRDHADAQVLKKPFQQRDLAGAIDRALG